MFGKIKIRKLFEKQKENMPEGAERGAVFSACSKEDSFTFDIWLMNDGSLRMFLGSFNLKDMNRLLDKI